MTDVQQFLDMAARLPENLQHGRQVAQNLEGLPSRDKIENIVLVGMGASGIAGDVVAAIAAPFIPIPIMVVKGYELPSFVNEASLVFALSFSGNTEETVEAANTAAVQGARVMAVASGGELIERVSSWGAPFVRIPTTIPVPRAAFGVLIAPVIAAFEDIGLFPGASQWLDLAIEQLKTRRDELTQPGNIAEKLAEKLQDKIVLVEGGGALGVAAAQRWKTQINENAKTLAFWSPQPELCHNEVIGWDALSDMSREQVGVVALRHEDEHPQIARRFELTHQHIESKVSFIEEVQADGDGALAQLLDLVMIGDFVSLYLAKQNQTSVGPEPFIDELRNQLKDHS